jgi:hypothetical protein
MELIELRPVLSGLIGGLVATALGVWWARWLPRGRDGKGPSILKLQYRAAIWMSNSVFLAGILGSLAMYRWGGFASNDWRPMALGAGVALCAPLVILPAAAMLQRYSVREAYVAYALSQGTPVVVLYPLLALGVPVLALALFYL